MAPINKTGAGPGVAVAAVLRLVGRNTAAAAGRVLAVGQDSLAVLCRAAVCTSGGSGA